MRAVIPYKMPGTGTELKYAVRSLYKHCRDLTGILLIGDKPDWFRGDHIPATDSAREKELRLIRKILLCPDELFLYTNDDFFMLSDFNAITLPDYYDRTCGEMAMRHGSPQYKRMYENCPPDWLNYDVHAPMCMAIGQFKAAYELMDNVQPIKTMYQQGRGIGLNLPLTSFRSGERVVDSKIRGVHTRAELDFHIVGRDFFSTHNSAVDSTMIRFLNDLYPDASPVE